MEKCNFCVDSLPDGCPFLDLPIHRRISCEKAIKRMEKDEKKKRKRLFK